MRPTSTTRRGNRSFCPACGRADCAAALPLKEEIRSRKDPGTPGQFWTPMAGQPWKSIRKTLVCNLQGKPFTESGFRSNWHQLMQAGLKGRKKTNGAVDFEPVIKEAFTFHDLRAKSGSDAADVQEANDPLAHDDPMTCGRRKWSTAGSRVELSRVGRWQRETGIERCVGALRASCETKKRVEFSTLARIFQSCC
jgi:hypothetical protein